MKDTKIFIIVVLFLVGFAFFPHASHASGPTTITGEINTPTTWTRENSPYKVFGNVVVKAPLAIEAGAIVKFARGSNDGLKIQNDFYVNGTRDEPVVFTSLRDDSVGGDTNEDGSNTRPAIGDWQGLMFNPFKDYEMKIRHAKIFYAGMGVSIYPSTGQTKDISIKNSEMRKNGIGIVGGNSEALIERNIIMNNANYGISMNASTKITKAINNSITDNGIGARGVNNINPEKIVLDAKYNWWGDKSGPQNADNSEGTGNSVTGLVLFDPWLKEDPIQNPDPAIIIPGIMGSWGKDGVWQIDPIFHTYDNLYEKFVNEGYVPEKNIFTFPYEWRDSNKVNAVELRAKIQEIKDETRRPKVDIVAHSMGGLLAREYIESSYYDNDVDQLITVGTPHSGAPKDYIKWEAGEFFFDIFEVIAKRIFTLEALEKGFIDVYHYIHNRPIISVQELLPVYNYLYNVENNFILRETYPNNYPQNEFLENLNDPVKAQLLKNTEFTKIVGRQNNNESTISGFNVVVKNDEELWKDGYPKNFSIPLLWRSGIVFNDGDQTVPLYSAESVSVLADNTITLQSEHNTLPTDAQKDILEILTGKRPASEVREWRIDDILMSLVFSPVDIQIVSPSGKKIGKNFETGKEFNDIPGAFYTGFDTDTEFLTIPNPENGEYKILTQGTGEGEYKIETTKITEDENDPQGARESTATIEGITQTGEIKNATIEVSENEVVYNPDTTPPILSNGLPIGELAEAVTESQISLATDEKAICKYSAEPDIPFDSMAGNFTTADGLAHTAQVSGLEQYKTYNFFAKCRDENGNMNQDDYPISFKVPDKTPPSITGAVTTEPNANGWYKDDVIVHFICNDSMSGPVQSEFDLPVTTEGLNQSVTGTCHDNAGNEASLDFNGINIDKTPPLITGSATTQPNSNGWYNSNVTVHFTATDEESGIESVTPDITISTEGRDQSATGTATDKAGNSASFTVSGINIDKTPPVISGALVNPPNENNWFKGDVTVVFICQDLLSGPVQSSFNIIISTEGPDQSAEGICEDLAGNRVSLVVSHINIDKTPPIIAVTSPQSQKQYSNDQAIPIIYQVTDNISPAEKITKKIFLDAKEITQTSIDLSLEYLGSHALKITAQDEAGNLSQAETNFTSKTNLDAIQNNANHYWELGLIKKKFIRKYLAIRLGHLENLFDLLEKTNSNLKLKPKIRENLAKEIRRAINQEIDQLIRRLDRKSPEWIDPKAASLLIESLNFIRP